MSGDLKTKDGNEIVGFGHAESAFRDLRSHVWLWVCAAIALVADLWSKSWAFNAMEPGEVREVAGGLLEFRLSLNPGALFGMGAGQVGIFIAASVGAMAFVLYVFAGSGRRQRMVHIALAFVLAGALGNLYDRVFVRYDSVRLADVTLFGGRPLVGDAELSEDGSTVTLELWNDPGRTMTFPVDELEGGVSRGGMVRDFLKFTTKVGGKDVWPWIYNIADVWLVVGVGLLLIGFAREGQRLRRLRAEAKAAGEES